MAQIKTIQRLSDWEPAIRKDPKYKEEVAGVKRRDEELRQAAKRAKTERMARETRQIKPKIQAHREQRRKIIASRKEY